MSVLFTGSQAPLRDRQTRMQHFGRVMAGLPALGYPLPTGVAYPWPFTIPYFA